MSCPHTDLKYTKVESRTAGFMFYEETEHFQLNSLRGTNIQVDKGLAVVVWDQASIIHIQLWIGVHAQEAQEAQTL